MNTRKPVRTACIFTVMLGVFVLFSGSLQAGLVVYEPFDYEPPEANIDGQDGGTGFDGAWISTISHGRIYWIRSPGLTFSTLPVAGNALSRYGSAGRAQAHRLLSAGSRAALTGEGTTIWFSVLFQESAPPYLHGTFIFGTEPLTTDTTPTLAAPGDGFGFTIQAAPDGSGQGNGSVNAIAYDNSTTPIVVAGTYTPDPQDATSLIVGKINWKPDGTADELFLFNVTNLSTEPAESAAFASITNLDLNQSAFDTIGMWDSNNSIFDEIRFGTSFGSVVGISDPNAPSVDAGPDMVSWSGEAVQLDPNIVEKPGSDWTNLTYLWTAEPADGVEFDPSAEVEAPVVTITKATENPSVVTLTLAVNNEGNPPEDAVIDDMTIDLYDDACIAALDLGLTELDPSDIDGDCTTDLVDFARLAARWLDDYTLTEPVPK